MSILAKTFCTIFTLSLVQVAAGQSPKAPLSRIINVPSTSQIAPSLSGDGRHMIFTTTANLKNELLLHYSTLSSSGKWSQPEPLAGINRSQKINHLGGYSLSYDGKYIFFTSRKTYGIGKYDIWVSEKMGNTWSAPKNLGKPINSAGDDGCPSISTDGQYLFFMRCNSMDQKNGNGCKLMMAKKRNKDQWGEPKPLPDHINNGNVMSPKILADGETLIYAKGEGDAIDLFLTRKTPKGWSKPQAMNYVNTEKNERFASVPGQGDVLYYSTMYKGTYDIIKAKIPEALQPKKIVLLRGQVVDQNNNTPLRAFIQLYDLESKELMQYYRTSESDGSFEFYIPAGRVYDFSVVASGKNYTFYSEQMDLTDLAASSRQKLKVALQPIAPAVSFNLNAVDFENDSTLTELAGFELTRLFKMLKNNPKTPIEIAVHRDTWETDSVFIEEVVDSLVQEFDSTSVADSATADSTTIAPLPPPDPTELKAQAIFNYLLGRGVPEHLIIPKGYGDSEPIAPNDTEENRSLNRRIEVRFL